VSEGRTVLLSSHLLAEVEALCDRVSIVRHGRTVESGSLADLRHLNTTSITVETVRPTAALAATPGVRELISEGTHARFTVDTAQLDGVLRALADLGVVAMNSSRPSLEDIFLRHYEVDTYSVAGK
jgi:ABC-2 type transport system ATP-binding protein